jgi:hypothetical protein
VDLIDLEIGNIKQHIRLLICRALLSCRRLRSGLAAPLSCVRSQTCLPPALSYQPASVILLFPAGRPEARLPAPIPPARLQSGGRSLPCLGRGAPRRPVPDMCPGLPRFSDPGRCGEQAGAVFAPGGSDWQIGCRALRAGLDGFGFTERGGVPPSQVGPVPGEFWAAAGEPA